MSEAVSRAAIRKAVEARARGICEYCRCPSAYAMHSFECEHIIPQSKGGAFAVDNLAWSCGGCNRFKAAKIFHLDAETNVEVALYNPREQQWKMHFAWSADYLELIGLSAVGRATIVALKLNRIGVTNLRSILILAGKHPQLKQLKSPN